MSAPIAPDGAAAEAFGGLAEDPATDPTDVEARTAALIARLTLDEQCGLMSGDGRFVQGTLEMAKRYNGEPIVAGAVPRLGLPGIRFTDGPRGVVMYHSTAFPSPMARAATFDPELEARIGDAIGVEARTQGANLFAGVCINLLRHPAWGRAQETYGEDSHLLGEMGAALVRGTQRHVMACVKHYAVNSMENSRFWLDVEIDEADLRDIYLPHFRRCVEEGAAGIMTAYNGVDGSPCGHHHHLITEVLKDEWGFEGFVMSDFTFGIHRAVPAVRAGLDLEMPYGLHFTRLAKLVAKGRVERSRIVDAATRLVRQQVRFSAVGEPDRYRPDAVAGPDHRALAREAAARSMVLLRNEVVPSDGAPVLPLSAEGTERLAVIGWLAGEVNLGDLGSSQVHPPTVATVLDGLRATGERDGFAVDHDDGRDRAAAASVAARSDAAVVVVGATFRDEGEWILRAGGDRSSLRLRARDEVLIATIAAANPRTVVVLMGGSAFAVDTWRAAAPSIVMAWYPGMEGGHAVADVLFGEAEPEGRLPCTWPTTGNELPPFRRFTRRIRYGPLHGYRLMASTGQEPAWWFGHGLGYADLTWGAPALDGVEPAPDGGAVATVSIDITNTSDRSGVEVVQGYVTEVLGTHPEALATLRAFQRIEVPAGETVGVRLEIPVAAGTTQVAVGRSADPAGLVPLELPTS